MKEVVWVVGVSAVGKETFIKKAVQNKQLQAKFGWTDKKLSICRESLDYIFQGDNEPILDKREEILVRAPFLLSSANVVLIKWQIVDSEALRPQRLKKLTQTANHEVIVLSAPVAVLTKRLSKKAWWHHPGKEKKQIAEESLAVAKVIEQLSKSFKVTTVNSSKQGNYKIIN